MNGERFPFFVKTTESLRVAYTQFLGVMNATSRMWMVRDWARREGYHLVGAPRCVFHFNGGTATTTLCEVQWGLAEAVDPSVEPLAGEVGVRILQPRRVAATYHQGDTTDLDKTAHVLREWGAAHGYQLGDTPCEIYWFDVRAPREEWITELQLPVTE